MGDREESEEPVATQTTTTTIADGIRVRKPRAIRRIIQDSEEEVEVMNSVSRQIERFGQELEATSGDKRKRGAGSDGGREDEGEDELEDEEKEKSKGGRGKRTKKETSPKKSAPPMQEVERVDGLTGTVLRQVMGKVSTTSNFGFILTISCL